MKFVVWLCLFLNLKSLMNWLKASTSTAIAQAARMLSGLIVIKMIAVSLGTEGFGRLGHFMSLISVLSVLAGGGILNGIVKYVAEYKSSPSRLHAFLSCAGAYSLLFSVLVCLVLSLFARQISLLLFDTDQYGSLIVFLAFIQFAYGVVSFCNGIINGLTETVKFAKISIVGTALGLPISCFCILQYGFVGAVVGLAVINACLLIPSLIAVMRLDLLQKIKLRFNRLDFKNIARFSSMQMVSLATLPLAEIFVRSLIAQYFGWQETGLWQSLMRLSAVYIGFFTMFLAAYYMPVLSSITDRRKSFNHVVKYLLGVGGAFIVIAVLVYVMRYYVFLIIFSKEFVIPANYVLYQLIGDFFKILSYVIGFLIVAKAKSTLYILGEFVQTGLYLGLAIIAIRSGQVENVFVIYAFSNFLYFLVCLTGLTVYGRLSLRIHQKTE